MGGSNPLTSAEDWRTSIMAHRVSSETRGGRAVITLRDDASGASASILPGFGFNLFDLRLPVAGRVLPMIHAAEGWADNPTKPGRNGIPVLFPFPNRIDRGKYQFGGTSYQIPINSGPHAIHGFGIQAPWEVIDQAEGADGASLTGRFQISGQAPEMLEHWPADAILAMTYTLSGRRLTLDVAVTNPTANDLPFGFGIHPYFRLPFAPGGDPSRTSIVLPASETWVLDEMIPTGERRPVDDRLDFRAGRPNEGLVLDDVLTGLIYGDDGHASCRLVDRGLGAEFRLGFDRAIRELVVFTPPNTPGVIAIEPYTQATDAINLQGRGIEAGLRTLGHDQRTAFRLTMETADLG